MGGEQCMPKEYDIEKLREEVNPVYGTAQSCLQIVAAIGDEDSENLRKVLGFTEFGADSGDRAANIPPEILKALRMAMPVFSSLPEARFFSSNRYFIESGVKTVVDLPCGYTSRGIKLAKSGIRYFGLDLPAVIDKMQPAIQQVAGENENIVYREVDATNYRSLRNALEGAEGELFITTEGLLMYFTQSELETVFGNIRRLLLAYGGKWVTLDNELSLVQSRSIGAVTKDLPQELAGKIGQIAAGVVSKTTLENNVFFDKDKEKARQFVSDMGFDLELVPMKDYMPETIRSYEKLPEDIRKDALDALQAVNFWVMTARKGTEEDFSQVEKDFSANVKLQDDSLNIVLKGRLDTISSPGLLALYREAEGKGTVKNICVDMSELDYISSAGLRVLLIMRKALKDDTCFSLINMTGEVRDILETTGFDTIFC